MNIFSHKNKTVTNNSPLIRQNSWHRIAREPSVDWIFIFLVSVLCAALLIVVGVTTYLDVDDTLSKPSETIVAHVHAPIDIKGLDSVSKYFEARTTKHDAILKGTAQPVDPSL